MISIMVGKTISKYSDQFSDSHVAKEASYSPIEVATLLCFIVGIIQVIFIFFKMDLLNKKLMTYTKNL